MTYLNFVFDVVVQFVTSDLFQGFAYLIIAFEVLISIGLLLRTLIRSR